MTNVLTAAPPAALPSSATELSSLSIVLPCFNEGQNVANAIAEASAAASAVTDSYEILIVDDGSADRTRELAEAIALDNSHVRVISHELNRGYGAAVRSGLCAARMDWILLTDGDLQFDLGELRGLVPMTADTDIVAGFRILRMDPVHRRANAAAWNWLVRRVLDVPLRDVDCAFKLMRRQFVQSLGLTAEGAMVSTELVAKARRHGARIVEAGVHHRPRVAGQSSGASPRVIAIAFRELSRIARELRTLSPDEPVRRSSAPRPSALGA